VVYGARDSSGEGPGGAPVRSIGHALKDADVVLLAVPGQAVPDVVSEQGAALAGKVVIDAVNRMGAPEFDSWALIADAAPSARYVRAFNSLGWENFANPVPGTNLFFAADPDARAAAEELISAVGLEPAGLRRRRDRDGDRRCPAAAVVRSGQTERRQPQARAEHRPLTLAAAPTSPADRTYKPGSG
jgi:NADP oxidoreductase coenzyme F420-dependent